MDKLSTEARSANMKAIRSVNTRPEMTVRRAVHRLGFRYRLHRRDLPGTPDLVFGPRQKAIFVHGCYWHGHGCKRGGKGAKSNAGYWGPKIARNKERDAKAEFDLREAGWQVLVLWECDLSDNDALELRLSHFLMG
ncbi:very short patch repair endonuclease [Mesorhizobium qingshengii]|uniref:Very short patch repair endonuclease n=1 Tax=Mesorhizobium qingshengii TaxID=1165689 RepID=A0ABT4R4L4_9HYPH|nr:very short patch repair endonuclease [Mesorhizobium qingshengii]MCZ8548701.1 very short patch repair endonuclease [Mesorhizobium qingshengii]